MIRFSTRFLGALLLVSACIPSAVFAQTPNDPNYDRQWYLEQISAPEAWSVTTGSASVVVAVLDVGVDIDHPDIEANIWENPGEIAGNDKDDDGNGFVDDINGWDFVEDSNDVTPDVRSWSTIDTLSHGTLIASMIAGIGDNGEGVAGLGWNVTIMPVRMLDSRGSGSEADATDAVDYAVENGADVINMSFAGSEAHAALRGAIERAHNAGVVVVAALGNDDRDTDDAPIYPACLRSSNIDWVIGVTSTDEDDKGSDFTNYGKTCSDVSAPGEDIFGALYQRRGTEFDEYYGGGWSGTSVASPLVAGAAALILSAYPNLPPDDVRTAIKLSVDPIAFSGSKTGRLGAGRLNVAAALALAETYSANYPSIDEDEPDVSSDTEEEAPAAEEAVEETPAAEAEPVPVKTSAALKGSFVAFGAPAGTLPMINVYRADGSPYANFQAYTSNFSGGVNVALSDINADGIPEVISGVGETGGPHVRIFKAYGAVVDEFFAYDMSSSHGVDIAAGDVDADGYVDVVTAVGAGVSQDIIVWSTAGVEQSRFTADEFPASVPLHVDLVDVDNDWQSEFAVSTGPGFAPMVAVYDDDGTLIGSFTPFSDTSGISVTAADVDGDYFDDIAVTSLGASRDVRVFTKIGALRKVMTEAGSAKGMRVAGLDVEVDGLDEILLMDNQSAGNLIIRSLATNAELTHWTAPSFGVAASPFIAAW